MLQKQDSSDRIIQYLQNLGREHMDLILEFAKPVLEKDTKDGLRIFTDDLHEVEQLSRPRVYDFLLKNFPVVVIPYLEHVINVWEDSNALFHNALIHQYRENAVSVEQDETMRQAMRQKLSNFLQKSEHFTPEIVLVHFPYDGRIFFVFITHYKSKFHFLSCSTNRDDLLLQFGRYV